MNEAYNHGTKTQGKTLVGIIMKKRNVGSQ